MMSPKKALDIHLAKELTDRWPRPVLDAVLAAIETYHKRQIKLMKK